MAEESRTSDAPSDPSAKPGRRSIRLFGRDIAMPRARWARIAIGCGLVVLGCLGFLPILGFWMIPLGLVVLSYEFAGIRRWRRRTSVRLGRWRRGRKNAGGDSARRR